LHVKDDVRQRLGVVVVSFSKIRTEKVVAVGAVQKVGGKNLQGECAPYQL
jgi:hypothetical protein